MAAPVFDVVGPSSAGGGGADPASPVTWSHTCAGSDRALFVQICVGKANGFPDSDIVITGVTYNSVAMTEVPGSFSHNNGGTSGYVVTYYLVAPATGANTVSIAFTRANAATTDVLVGGSLGWTDAHQTTPYGTVTVATGASTTASGTITSDSGKALFATVGSGADLSAPTQTGRWLKNVNQNSGGGNGAGSTANGAASVTFEYTITPSDSWSVVAIEVVPAAGGGPSPTLMGASWQ